MNKERKEHSLKELLCTFNQNLNVDAISKSAREKRETWKEGENAERFLFIVNFIERKCPVWKTLIYFYCQKEINRIVIFCAFEIGYSASIFRGEANPSR